MTATTDIFIVTTTDPGGNTRQQQIQIPRTINATTARALVVNNGVMSADNTSPEIVVQAAQAAQVVQAAQVAQAAQVVQAAQAAQVVQAAQAAQVVQATQVVQAAQAAQAIQAAQTLQAAQAAAQAAVASIQTSHELKSENDTTITVFGGQSTESQTENQNETGVQTIPIQVQTIRPGRSSSIGTLDKPFQCNVCERKFRQLSTLTNHVKIHTGEKPYKCSICEKFFRQSSTLTNHVKIHTGEKPFNCIYCVKTFRQLSTLTNHLKIHTGEKPFECVVCKKQFRQSSTLNNHIKIHVMDKLYIPPPFEIKEEEEEVEG